MSWQEDLKDTLGIKRAYTASMVIMGDTWYYKLKGDKFYHKVRNSSTFKEAKLIRDSSGNVRTMFANQITDCKILDTNMANFKEFLRHWNKLYPVTTYGFEL